MNFRSDALEAYIAHVTLPYLIPLYGMGLNVV